MAGTQNTSIRSYNFFVSGSLAGGGTYGENKHEFIDVDDQTPFLSHSVLIVNDGGADISFRFSAPTGASPAAHGVVATNEQIQLDFKRARQIYLSGTGGTDFRIWAW